LEGSLADMTAWTMTRVFVGEGRAYNQFPFGLAVLAFQVANAALIGVNLGPNLSVTGSLATILWLAAIRREGVQVSAWKFLGMGLLVMPPALVLSILAMAWSAGAP
jgi:arsenical pump membrane protein